VARVRPSDRRAGRTRRERADRGRRLRSHAEHRVYGPARPGQTSYQLAGHGVVSSAAQTPVPIASLAKVMTAYLVLRDHPLGDGDGDLDLP